MYLAYICACKPMPIWLRWIANSGLHICAECIKIVEHNNRGDSKVVRHQIDGLNVHEDILPPGRAINLRNQD